MTRQYKRKKPIRKDSLELKPIPHTNNPGMIMGRSIAFAKFTHIEEYVLCGDIEPCWKHNSTKELFTSSQLYMKYIHWLKNT